MTNAILGLIAALLWGAAYGGYFAPELRAWWHRRRGLPPPRRTQYSYHPRRAAPMRARPPRIPITIVVPAASPRPAALFAPEMRPAALAPPAAAPDRPSNVVPFPRQPRG